MTRSHLTSIISALLLLIMLLNTACSNNTNVGNETEQSSETESISEQSREESTEKTESESAEDTEETESESSDLESYTDISGEFVYDYNMDNTSTVVTSSTGSSSISNYTIRLDENENNFSISSFVNTGSYHDVANCADCAYTQKNGENVLHICDNTSNYSSLSIVLDTPIKASVVTGITMTYMTSDEVANASQIRILKPDFSTINSDGAPDLSGATEEWKTVDFKMSTTDIDAMTDEDGFIHELRFLFRDKDDTDIYIKDFTFTVSVEKLCKTEMLVGNYFGRGDVLDAISKKIADELTASNIGAEIELRNVSFRQSSALINGIISYRVKITDISGTSVTYSSLSATISRVKGVWLTLGHDIFYAEHDSKEQWKTNFDRSGIIFLEDNLLKGREPLKTVEYAVIAADGDVTDQAIVWHTPHYLAFSDDGTFSLYANAALDYGSALTEGSSYRFLVRGITKYDNYILHLDIPFTYSQLVSDPISALGAAKEIIDASSISCDKDEENKLEFVKNALEALINNENINVNVSFENNGMLSGSYNVALSYTAGALSERFPSYKAGDGERSDFFAYNGAFYNSLISITYATQQSNLKLVSPADGANDLRIASDDIVRFWNTDSEILVSNSYTYAQGERCDPVPVTLVWSDPKSKDECYVVFISESEDFSDAWSFITYDTSLDVYNLKAGQRYYWMVESSRYSSAVFTFVTESGYTRFIDTEKLSNFRDIGGYTTIDGKTVKQGLAFRVANFDSVSSSDISLITNNLGIITDLDLRGESTSSPLGPSVTACPISIKWYNGIFTEEEGERIRQAITVFANEENYPIGYHCAVGRDRTGTVTILLLGVLGVDQDTILKEFMLSLTSVSGNNMTSASLYHNYQALMKGLNNYGEEGDSFNERIEAYLLSIGVTEQEIASIRDILLED